MKKSLILNLVVIMMPAFAQAQCLSSHCAETVNPSLSESLIAADTGATAADRLKAELNEVGVERFTASTYKPGVVKHIVLFRYAPGVSPEQKRQAMNRFLALKQLANRNHKPYIVSIVAGNETSGEGADQALEQGFIVTFKSQGDRNFYVGQPVVTDAHYYDPAHQSFKDSTGPLLDKNGALVFDFNSTKSF